MITEIARILVKSGQHAAFEAAVARTAEVFAQAEGCLGVSLMRCIEVRDSYDVVIRWTTLEAHTVTFREGPLFGQWRALVGEFFAAPPEVRHFETKIAPIDFT